MRKELRRVKKENESGWELANCFWSGYAFVCMCASLDANKPKGLIRPPIKETKCLEKLSLPVLSSIQLENCGFESLSGCERLSVRLLSRNEPLAAVCLYR